MKKPIKKIKKAKPLTKTVTKVAVQSDPLETPEAESIIKKAIRSISELDGKASTIALTLVEIRFKQGCLIRDAMEKKGRYGEGLIKHIAKEVKMTSGYLYQL